MRNKNKKLELAQKNNTRVIYCNVPETQIMLKPIKFILFVIISLQKNPIRELFFAVTNKHCQLSIDE